MQLGSLLTVNLIAIAVVMLIIWGVATIRRDTSIVDIFWGAGFVLIAWISVLASGQHSLVAWLLVAMVTVWGMRLTGYLGWRNLGKPEDYRYRAMREHHGDRFAIISLFTVFGLQGLLMWIISLPIQVGISRASGWHVGLVAGASFGLWVCSSSQWATSN